MYQLINIKIITISENWCSVSTTKKQMYIYFPKLHDLNANSAKIHILKNTCTTAEKIRENSYPWQSLEFLRGSLRGCSALMTQILYLSCFNPLIWLFISRQTYSDKTGFRHRKYEIVRSV